MDIKVSHITHKDGDSRGLCGARLEDDPADGWQMCQDCFRLAMDTDVHLWLALEFEAESQYTVGIYSTRELAEAGIEHEKTQTSISGWRDFRVEHYILDRGGEEDN